MGRPCCAAAYNLHSYDRETGARSVYRWVKGDPPSTILSTARESFVDIDSVGGDEYIGAIRLDGVGPLETPGSRLVIARVDRRGNVIWRSPSPGHPIKTAFRNYSIDSSRVYTWEATGSGSTGINVTAYDFDGNQEWQRTDLSFATFPNGNGLFVSADGSNVYLQYTDYTAYVASLVAPIHKLTAADGSDSMTITPATSFSTLVAVIGGNIVMSGSSMSGFSIIDSTGAETAEIHSPGPGYKWGETNGNIWNGSGSNSGPKTLAIINSSLSLVVSFSTGTLKVEAVDAVSGDGIYLTGRDPVAGGAQVRKYDWSGSLVWATDTFPAPFTTVFPRGIVATDDDDRVWVSSEVTSR